MNDQGSFKRLLEAMRRGSHEAAWELVERYEPHIRAVVRRHLAKSMRTQVDSDDYVQNVWVSLFQMQERLDDIDEPKKFVAYLARMARNKVIDDYRHAQAAKRDISRQRPLDALSEVSREQLTDSLPTASQVAIARERWLELVEHLSDRDRKILELRLARCTYQEIAQQLKMHERSVRRIVERLLSMQTARWSTAKAGN